MSFLALAAVLNIAGANLALLIRIPLYLDTLGTFLAAILFGPFYGMVPGFLSGILTGMTTDIYSLFYLPVQLLTGLTAGLFFYENHFGTENTGFRCMRLSLLYRERLFPPALRHFYLEELPHPVPQSWYSSFIIWD